MVSAVYIPAMILVRHGNAGSKAAWHQADELRPLSDLGLAQTQSLVTTLADEEITTVWCSPSVRCQQTVEPLAAADGLRVRTTDRLSTAANPAWLLAWLRRIGTEAPVVFCTHGEVLTALYAAARRIGAVEVATRKQTEKGALWRVSAHPHRPGGPLQLAYTPPSPTRWATTLPAVHPALADAR